MQNEETLLELGFKHFPEWDSKETNTKEYRLECNGFVFRAHVWDKTHGFPNEKQFVSIGIVVENEHLVDMWRDCCSNGSVKRFIDKIINPLSKHAVQHVAS